jgi:hypothetical protein
MEIDKKFFLATFIHEAWECSRVEVTNIDKQLNSTVRLYNKAPGGLSILGPVFTKLVTNYFRSSVEGVHYLQNNEVF